MLVECVSNCVSISYRFVMDLEWFGGGFGIGLVRFGIGWDPCGVGLGAVWDRCGSVWHRFGSNWVRFGIALGSVRGRFGIDLGTIWTIILNKFNILVELRFVGICRNLIWRNPFVRLDFVATSIAEFLQAVPKAGFLQAAPKPGPRPSAFLEKSSQHHSQRHLGQMRRSHFWYAQERATGYSGQIFESLVW